MWASFNEIGRVELLQSQLLNFGSKIWRVYFGQLLVPAKWLAKNKKRSEPPSKSYKQMKQKMFMVRKLWNLKFSFFSNEKKNSTSNFFAFIRAYSCLENWMLLI